MQQQEQRHAVRRDGRRRGRIGEPTRAPTRAGPPAGGAAGADAGKDAPATPTTTLFLVGDSTVAAFNDPYYYPRYGYGTQIGKYLDASVAVNNLALSGRSSKSFIDPLDNANYATFKSSLKAGDYVLIGFGHNDEKADPSLYTNPKTDVTDPTSFQYYLYTYYVKVAQDAGAIPILATPVVRRDSSGAYTGAKVHVTTDVVSGGVTYPGGDYPQAIRDLGAATGTVVIDNTASTLALGKQIFAASGAAGTAQLQAWVSNMVTSVDDTHTNIYGGATYAYEVATGLLASTSSLKDHVLPGIVPPDIAILVPNPNWTPIVYSPPAKSTNWTTTDPWMGSVFGDVGGTTKITGGSFAITETSTAPLVVSLTSGSPTVSAGKIAAATDGIAFYFQQVPIAEDFVLSATATVTSVTFSNSQVGFGLMVRDAAWTDVSDASLAQLLRRRGAAQGERARRGVAILHPRHQRPHPADRNRRQRGGGRPDDGRGARPVDRQVGVDVHLHVRDGSPHGLHDRPQRDRRQLRLRGAVHGTAGPDLVFEHQLHRHELISIVAVAPRSAGAGFGTSHPAGLLNRGSGTAILCRNPGSKRLAAVVANWRIPGKPRSAASQ